MEPTAISGKVMTSPQNSDFPCPVAASSVAGEDMKPALPPSTAPGLLRRHLLWWLVLAYALAAWFPAWGLALRHFELGHLPISGSAINTTHWLLAWLLFSVGMSIRIDQIWEVVDRPATLGLSIVCGWVTPLLALGLLALVLPPLLGTAAWSAFFAGALLVVAMPPASSSTVWSELSGGRVAVTVSIVVLGTTLCPLLTPLILNVAGTAVTADVVGPATMNASLEVLLLFVALPVVAGIAVRSLLRRRADDAGQTWMRLMQNLSICGLLILNYSNGAVALPRLIDRGVSLDAASVAIASVVLCAAVFGLALVVGRRIAGSSRPEQFSFAFVASMKNTGAALVLASTLLADQPLAVLVPVFYTIAQHLSAAIIDRSAGRVRPRIEATEGSSVLYAQATSSSY
jgi:BASS family bile acid:Na+ symporter